MATQRDELGDAGEVSGTSEERVNDSDADADGSEPDVPEAEDFFEGEESARVERVEETRLVGDEGQAVLSSSSSLRGWREPCSGGCRRVSSFIQPSEPLCRQYRARAWS